VGFDEEAVGAGGNGGLAMVRMNIAWNWAAFQGI